MTHTGCSACDKKIEYFLKGYVAFDWARRGVIRCNRSDVDNKKQLALWFREMGYEVPEDLRLNLP